MTAPRREQPYGRRAPAATAATGRRALGVVALGGLSLALLPSCGGRRGETAVGGGAAAGVGATEPPRPGRLPVHRFAVSQRRGWEGEVNEYFAEVFQAALVDELRRAGVPADPAAGSASGSGPSVDGRLVSAAPGGPAAAAEVRVAATVRGPAGQTRQVETVVTAGEGAVPAAMLPSAIVSERPDGAGLMAIEKARLTDGARRAARLVARRLAPAIREAGVPAAAGA